MQDWLSLFDFQNTSRQIYCYNYATRVDQPCQSAALWPVLWILARFPSSSHLVCSIFAKRLQF